MSKLRITWVKSAIGYNKDQKKTLKALFSSDKSEYCPRGY